jgi:putative ABC transport system permease protein
MLATGMRGTLLKAGSDRKALVMQHGAYAEDDSRIRQAVLALVAAAPGVRRDEQGAPLVSGEALVQIFVSRADDVSRISSVQVRGVSANVGAIRPEVRVTSGRLPRPGSDEAMIGRSIDGLYEGLTSGGHLTLEKGRDLPIVGVFEANDSAYESEIWTGLDVMQSSLGWEGYLSSVTAVLDSEKDFDAFATTLEADKTGGLSVARERAYYDKISEGLSRSIRALGDLVTLIFACGAMLGAAITMNGAIAQRPQEK